MRLTIKRSFIRLAANDIPHLAYMGADARWGTPWKEAGQQWDHRGVIDDTYYNLDLIPSHGPNGEIYEIPLGTSFLSTVLFMNTSLVESLGLTQPETYEDIVSMVPIAKAAGLDVVSIDGADGWAWASCLLSVLIARTSGDPNWVSKAVAGENKFTDTAFIDALSLIERMVADEVISSKSILVDYGTNISNFNNEKALFMVQGHWVSGSVENPAVADNMRMMAWPVLPGEKASTAGSIAAAWSIGYGLTKAGADDPAVRDAALKFLNYFYSHSEVEQRLRNGDIVAPILHNFSVPEDLPNSVKQKVLLAGNSLETEVIDAYLTGAPNEALKSGIQKNCSVGFSHSGRGSTRGGISVQKVTE